MGHPGHVDGPYEIAGPKVPSPFPIRMDVETVKRVELLPSATRSSFPSPLRSPTATTPAGPGIGKVDGAPKVPSPCPSRTETELSEVVDSAMSGTPSPLKSAVTKRPG